MNEDIQKYSRTDQFYVIRLTLSATKGMDVVLGHVDIKEAYL